MVSDILNCSYSVARLPQSWKEADIAPVPKQIPADDVNKHLRPISLTPVLSKLTEDFVVDRYVKPAVLAKVDPRQFGTVPGSNTSEALVSMIHTWNSATDGNGATVRVLLFEFKKAFDLIDHRSLVGKLCSCDIPALLSVGSSISSLGANSELNLAMTASQNGDLYRRGFPKAQKFGTMAVHHDDQRA